MNDGCRLSRPDTGERHYYSISQAAALLGVSRVSIWRWIRAGWLPVMRLGHRTARIRRDDLERVLVQIGPVAPRSVAVQRLRVDANAEDHADLERAPREDRNEMRGPEHFVQFYETDAFLLDTVAGFIAAALRDDDAGIVVATEAHREGLAQRLAADGLDVAADHGRGMYLALDAAETLSSFMVDGAPGPERFMDVIGGIIEQARAGRRRVRVFGEMVALLAVEGNPAAAIRLEELWNALQRTQPFSLFCAYPMNRLGREDLVELLGSVCAEHTHVIPAESYTALPTPDDRLRAVTVLQQKAQRLEAEIAERRRVEDLLLVALASERAAREEAEAALRLRNEFLSIAAHELKTPITTLGGYAQFVLRQNKRQRDLEPEHLMQSLQIIAGQAGRLSRLLDQLLDISRLEAGRLTLDRQPTDLVALVEQVVSGARAWSDRHVITLTVPPTLEAMVDPLRLEQVVTNLLDNAIKYSPDGGPVEVELSRVGGTAAELMVRDWGLGIPLEKRGQIFERFYQAHSGGHQSGMGLGLYISRRLVEAHGGEIRAEFPPDGGTSFTVRLPVNLDEPAAAHALPWALSDIAGIEPSVVQHAVVAPPV
ncbi:MAG: MEDS domain-containing protein [Chloroflexi bacterium]|nr:MEDS domain-containing protein [Chloroflexota bacterium]